MSIAVSSVTRQELPGPAAARPVLALDARHLHSGIGTYTLNLLRGLAACAGDFELHVITSSAHVETLRPLCRRLTVVDAPIYGLREQWEVARAAAGADLLHVPHYNVPLAHRGRMLVTIHDLTHLMVRGAAPRAAVWFYARPMLALAARKAAHIVTVSEYSKSTLVERLRVDPSRVTVIPNGVSRDFRPMDRNLAARSVEQWLGVRRPYLLFVGNLKPHKDVEVLLGAFRRLCAEPGFRHQLVVVGDDRKRRNRFASELRALGIAERVAWRHHVPNALLPAVYAAADILVFPSRHEGFGLPVLEAMACGTPVLCARASSLPEVAGEAAEYFQPGSEEALASALMRMLASPRLCRQLRASGAVRASAFQWDSAAERHVRIYRQVLAQTGALQTPARKA
jgi:glycosyltransferase involved in cell wall biosynthesis